MVAVSRVLSNSVCSALVVACATTLTPQAVAAVPPAAVSTLIAKECRGACTPRFERLENGKLLLSWLDDKSALWTQLMAASGRELLGEPTVIPDIATALRPLYQPLTIPLLRGDVAIVGVLASGRITVTRGSEEPARRFAPKVFGASNDLEVLDVAAAARGEGLIVLTLRGPHLDDPRAVRDVVDVEVRLLDADGNQVNQPLAWKSPFGVSPRITTCGGQYFVALQTNAGIRTTTISADFGRASTKLLPYERGVAADLGPLRCNGTGARLFSGWRKSATSFDLAPLVNVAEIRDKEPAPKGRAWKTVKLSAPPYIERGRLDVYPKGDDYQVVVRGARAASLVTITADALTSKSTSLSLPRFASCVPLSGGEQASCSEIRRNTTVSGACENITTEIKVSTHGTDVSSGLTRTAGSSFWLVRPVPDADAEPTWVRERERSLVRCTAAEFRPLQDALREWCENTSTRPSVANGFRAYCDTAESESLLSQATNCGTKPRECGPSPLENIPSVSREDFERGKRVELGYMNCSVRFSRVGTRWQVADHECEGE
jgi:hypothetical protein